MVPKSVLEGLLTSPFRPQILLHAEAILRKILDAGIASVSESDIGDMNPDFVELSRLENGRPVNVKLPRTTLTTRRTLGAVVDEELASRYVSRAIAGTVAGLVLGFTVENVYFDIEQSNLARSRVKRSVEPVMLRIGRGEKLIERGSMVTGADISRLAAVRSAVRTQTLRTILGQTALLVAACAFSWLMIMRGGPGQEWRMRRTMSLLAIGFSFLYFCIAFALRRFASFPTVLETGSYLPTSLLAMLSAVFGGFRAAIPYSLVLGFISTAGSGIDGRLLILVLASANIGALVVRGAVSRIDLVRASLLQGILQACVAAVVTLDLGFTPLRIGGFMLAQAANGFVCGVFALAIMPVLEQSLNIPTRFRLIELSDLNTPTMKRMQSIAPGTYSHSISVAHLAETACREIGADALLARVGGYYHDIGKLEQPEYFIENQTGYNKHDEINPRLSATVIRSHVKIGAEKARALGLPQAVVDIVAQHHGNSVIMCFYEQARQEEDEVLRADFVYNGERPESREAGVVMLADSVEAASRTLNRPTVPKLEQFIRDIVNTKYSESQLDRCDLTLRDLDTIRSTFLKILAGHYHSRIEYPKSRSVRK